MKLGIGTELRLFRRKTQRSEILRYPFIEPGLRRGIVILQEIMRQLMFNRAVAVRLRGIQHKKGPVIPDQGESGDFRGSPAPERSQLPISPFVRESDDVDGLRHPQL